MSTAIIYFGAQISGNQVVSENVAAKGLSLIRINPAHYNITGYNRGPLPLYNLYTDYLPAFIYSAYEDARVTLRNMKYPGFPPTAPTSRCMLSPCINLVFHFSNKDQSQLDGLREIFPDVVVTKSFGNNIYILPYFTGSLKDITTRNPVIYTKTGEGQANIAAYRSGVRVARALDVLLRTNQYASYKNSTPTEAELWQQMDLARTAEVNMMVDTDGTMEDRTVVNVRDDIATKVNLAIPPRKYEYSIENINDIPADYDLTFFAYVSDLSNHDMTTVPDFLDKYCVGLFSSDADDDDEIRRDIRGHWGILCRSGWGQETGHIVKVQGLAFQTQTFIKLLYNGGTYLGSFLCGSNYVLRDPIKGTVTSHTHQQMSDMLLDFFPHTKAMKELLPIITACGQDRAWLETSVTSSSYYCSRLESLTTDADQRRELYRISQALSFKTGYLPITCSNVINAIEDIMNDVDSDENTPRHPISLFEQSRITKSLARFGRNAFSFLVPGGRNMPLSDKFVTKINQPIRGGGSKVIEKMVGRIGAVIVPLKVAVADYERMLINKSISNPFGNAVTRASTSSIVKVYEGSDCQIITAALRKAAKIDLVDNANPKKRGAENAEAGSSKRAKGMADVDD